MKAEETMSTIYVYVLDTLADWELGHVTSELNSGRFFKQGAQRMSLKTVSYSKEPIITMGGLTILPNCSIDDMAVDGSKACPCHPKSRRIPLFRGSGVRNLRRDRRACQRWAIGPAPPYQ